MILRQLLFSGTGELKVTATLDTYFYWSDLAYSDGRDIRFYDEKGDRCEHYAGSWDFGSYAELYVHKPATISELWMEYGWSELEMATSTFTAPEEVIGSLGPRKFVEKVGGTAPHLWTDFKPFASATLGNTELLGSGYGGKIRLREGANTGSFETGLIYFRFLPYRVFLRGSTPLGAKLGTWFGGTEQRIYIAVGTEAPATNAEGSAWESFQFPSSDYSFLRVGDFLTEGSINPGHSFGTYYSAGHKSWYNPGTYNYDEGLVWGDWYQVKAWAGAGQKFELPSWTIDEATYVLILDYWERMPSAATFTVGSWMGFPPPGPEEGIWYWSTTNRDFPATIYVPCTNQIKAIQDAGDNIFIGGARFRRTFGFSGTVRWHLSVTSFLYCKGTSKWKSIVVGEILPSEVSQEYVQFMIPFERA